MKRLIFVVSLAAVVALPGLVAQEPSPGKTVPLIRPVRINGQPSKTGLADAPGKGVNPQPVVHQVPAKDPGKQKTTNNASNRISYAEAVKRYRNERHDRDWWKRHNVIIVLVVGGYYYWDSGYWYPAWGYDRNYENYAYNGPIYTYGNLLPDQVIINVQQALKDRGYYDGDLTGSLGVSTRHALGAYQADNGLDVTRAVDEPTVLALGLVEG